MRLKPGWPGPCHARWPGLSDSCTAVDCRDRNDSGSQKTEAAAEAATPATAPLEKSSNECGQVANTDFMDEAGNEGLKEPSTAGSSRGRDARLITIKTGPEATAQEGTGAAAAAAGSDNVAVDSGTADAAGSGSAAEASDAAAAAPEGADSASGGGREPATPRQEGPASRRSASGSLEAVSVQSRSKVVASAGSEAPGMAGLDSDLSALGTGGLKEPQQQPGWSTAEGCQPEQAGPEAAEGSTPEETEPQ